MISIGEHNGFNDEVGIELSAQFCEVLQQQSFTDFFKRKKDEQLCFSIKHVEENKYTIKSSYIIGVNWVVENELPIYIHPKLNTENNEIDYLKMLFEALQEPENFNHLDDLYTIDFDAPLIEIEQHQDKLTPLLLLEFLQLLKQIVRRGLKKSYYKVTKNLNSRVKGKVLINATVKQNHSKQKMLYNVCQYEEFGYNSLENRILKKALLFTQSALANFKDISKEVDLQHVFNFVSPAFGLVDENIDERTLKNIKPNPLFKEYTQALKLAKLILKKYGYNISNTTTDKIKTPPFWIDMSKLFELYVFKKLKEVFPKNKVVKYHLTINQQEPDFVLNCDDLKMVIDAKYKPRYFKSEILMDDARQISGYARMKKMYQELNEPDLSKVLDCLVIYPDQTGGIELLKSNLKNNPSKHYVHFYKVGIKLPVI